MKISLSSSMAAFWSGPCSMSCLRSWSTSQSVHSWVQFLPAAESSLGIPGAARTPAPGTQLQETHYQFCIFCIITLIIIIITIISIISLTTKTFYIQFVSLSPFSFPFLWWEGGG